MRYALLIYTAEATEQPSQDVMAAELAGYDVFTQHLRDAGKYEAGEALATTATATTVRVRDGKTLATDGPFAETKEALGGFYLLEAADLDEAISFAAMIPGARHGSIEIRPIYEFTADSAAAGVGASSSAN